MQDFLEFQKQVEGALDFLLSSAKKKNLVKDADVVCSVSNGVSISYRDRKLEESFVAEDFNIGLRVILSDGRCGVASANSLAKDVLSFVVENAYNNSLLLNPDPNVFIQKVEEEYKTTDELKLYDKQVADMSYEQRIDYIKQMEERVSNGKEHVKSLRSISWSDSVGITSYASTKGVFGSFRSTTIGASVVLVVEKDGNRDMTGFSSYKVFKEDFDPNLVVDRALKLGLLSLGGKVVTTGRYDVVLDPSATAQLISVLMPSFLASSVYKGRSLFVGKIGKKIASSCINILDDGLLEKGLVTRPFDGEGVPSKTTLLVENGVLKTYLNNLKYAKLFDHEPTGNASRSAGSIPGVSPTNVILKPGKRSLDDIMRDVVKGVYITEFMGLHTVNPVTGDFSVGAKGALIENGQITKPVSGIAISGNMIEFLKQVDDVASNFEFIGSMGVSSVILRSVTIAGS